MSQISSTSSLSRSSLDAEPVSPAGVEGPPPPTTGSMEPPRSTNTAVANLVEAFDGWSGVSRWSPELFAAGPTVSAGSLTAAAFPPPALATDSGGRSYPTSSDGTPLYRQGDSAWSDTALGTGSSIGAAGCAMTSTAMALSKISGQTMNPAQLDAYLDTHDGYVGNAIHWDRAAQALGLHATKPDWSLDVIDQQLDAGRPVVIGVDYKAGEKGGGNGTDHWIALTGRGVENGKPVYYANDPATGRELTLSLENGRLVGPSPDHYKSTGELVVFSGGAKRPAGPPKAAFQGPARQGPASQGPARQGPAREGPASSRSPTGGSGPAQVSTSSRPTMLQGLTLPGGSLKRGASGTDVRQLQQILIRTGYLTQADAATGPGVFGPRTEAALKAFQSAHGLATSGVYESATRAAFAALGATPATKQVNHASFITPALTSTPGSRSQETYDQVIDQFDVERNPRYARDEGGTYCNIYVWDVTLAMGAEIPHFVDTDGNPTTQVRGAKELTANDVDRWLKTKGAQRGWRQVTAKEAQAEANKGKPVVASAPKPGGHGHVAVVRPGEDGASNPATSQAGGTNRNHGTASQSFNNDPGVTYWAHD